MTGSFEPKETGGIGYECQARDSFQPKETGGSKTEDSTNIQTFFDTEMCSEAQELGVPSSESFSNLMADPRTDSTLQDSWACPVQ